MFYMLPQWLQNLLRFFDQKKISTKWRVVILAGVPVFIALSVFLGIWFGTMQGYCGARYKNGPDTRKMVRYELQGDELLIEADYSSFEVAPDKRLVWNMHRNRITSLTVLKARIYRSVFEEMPNLREMSTTGDYIGRKAFMNCKALESIDCRYVTTLDNQAFYGCTSLNDVGEIVTLYYLGDGAFNGCTALESFHIPGSLMTINQNAFRNCTSLTSVTGMNGLAEIGENAFRGCESLKEVALPATSYGLSIGNCAFIGCSALEEITLPANTFSLGAEAFRDCTSLRSCVIQEGPLAIGASCFNGCTSLEEMELPVGVSEIGKYAFRGCTGIEEITVPATVLSLDGTAFAGWTAEQTVILHCSRTALQGPLETDAMVIWDN